MKDAWSNLSCQFTLGGHKDAADVPHYPGPYIPPTLLQKHPVDILVQDFGKFYRCDPKQDLVHMTITAVSRTANKPRVVIESWNPCTSTWSSGPLAKGTRTRWRKLGYYTHTKRIRATDVGGAIAQARLLVCRVPIDQVWKWPPTWQQEPARPMSNLLIPDGLIPPRAWGIPPTGYSIDAQLHPMPWDPPRHSAYIKTPKGSRRLTTEELAKGLGATGDSLATAKTLRNRKLLEDTTSLFHWEYLGQAIQGSTDQAEISLRPNVTLEAPPSVDDLETGPPAPSIPFHWRPPDLSPGARWFYQRLRSLWSVARKHGRRVLELFNNGLDCLAKHRGNYDRHGSRPTKLQILWWEFPPEHWQSLREGSSMNFLQPPPAKHEPNGEMDDEQLATAGEFVDELIDLTVVREAPSDMHIHSTTPLFALPKPGQPGQWRIIADMKKGGQNTTVCSEPVYLNRPLHILDQLYHDGWSAVVDASKFFYQFATRPEDYPYLGLIHPVTGKMYYWASLPMGAGNSPACGCRHGLAFLRLVRRQLVAGSKLNTWQCTLTGGDYDPKLGHGFVLTAPEGGPAVRIWAHVDDFLIHGPTVQATQWALRIFMDIAIQVGLLCHPHKLIPPTQVPKYTGFIFDTRGVPTLRIPTDKRERALAMVQHLLDKPNGVSCLALAVVVGTLESLSDATPSRLGHTHLRSAYSIIHPDGAPPLDTKYYGFVDLTQECARSLRWWELILHQDVCRPARRNRSATLVPTYGDGSGTGTGGTIQLPDAPLQMWMGQWSPHVFSYSSNWKELNTLNLTLTQLEHTPHAIRETTVFYFTDNIVTYFICNAGSSTNPILHSLVESILLRALRLRCDLHVIHVPGKLLIHQGTDGLSRGVWMSYHNWDRTPENITKGIFCAVQPTPAQWDQLLFLAQAPRSTPIWPSAQPPHPDQLLHRWTAFHPSPEAARQAIIFFMETWVESPYDTGGVFIIPRVLTASWHFISKHVREVAVLAPGDVAHPAGLPIPSVLLVISPFCASLPTSNPSMDHHRGPPHIRRLHKTLATDMRTLQPTSVVPGY